MRDSLGQGDAARRAERHAELGRRFFAEQDRLRGGPARELCAPGYTAQICAFPPMNRDGHEGFALQFYAAFAGIRHEIDHVVADANAVAVRFALVGEHTGDWFGVPASRRPIRVFAHAVLEIEGGVVTRLRAVFDEAGLLRQIGALPG